MILRIVLAIVALLLLAVLGLGGYVWYMGQSGGDPDFFESEIAAFEAADAERMPEPGGIVFTGSSSIRFWTTLAEDMAPLPTVRRGFGGAHMEHVIHNARRIVTKYEPRAIVVYVGTNDLSSGKSVTQIADDFRTFISVVREELPETDFWLMSQKPSKLRWSNRPIQRELDAELEKLADADPRVRYVPTGLVLLTPNGEPDDVYVWDRLHLNAEGYRRWTEYLKPLLLEAYGSATSGE